MLTSHRAWVWEGSPDPDDLFLIQLPLPELVPSDVLVRNSMIGLNPHDWKNLECKPAEWLGHVPGADGAGIVVAVDERVPNAWLGTWVAYNQSLDKSGSFAEYTAVPVRNLMRLPASVGWVDAASFPTPALTTWLAMTNLAKHGDRLLISGTAGSTAHYLIQLAAQSGHSVTIMGNRHDCALLSVLEALGRFHLPYSRKAKCKFCTMLSAHPSGLFIAPMRVSGDAWAESTVLSLWLTTLPKHEYVA